MSIVRKSTLPKQDLDERRAITLLASQFEWYRNLVIPNAYMCGGEMDVAVVTNANYLWEIEVKLTLSDWKADQFKDKWKHRDRKYVNRFYYAVPQELIHSIPDFVSKETGIIEIYHNDYSGWRINVVRAPKTRRGDKITDRMRAQFIKKVYFRYWGKRIKDSLTDVYDGSGK